MGICLTSVSFSMSAEVKRQHNDNPDDPTDNGQWVLIQDPDTGEVTRVWRSFDNPETTDVDESVTGEVFPCLARGILSTGIRNASATQNWSELYRATDIVQLQFPADVIIRRNDHIINIRDSAGNLVWREEEMVDAPGTTFIVNGVVPIVDAYNNHVKNFALLERADVQSA